MKFAGGKKRGGVCGFWISDCGCVGLWVFGVGIRQIRYPLFFSHVLEAEHCKAGYVCFFLFSYDTTPYTICHNINGIIKTVPRILLLLVHVNHVKSRKWSPPGRGEPKSAITTLGWKPHRSPLPFAESLRAPPSPRLPLVILDSFSITKKWRMAMTG